MLTSGTKSGGAPGEVGVDRVALGRDRA
jgi:hypothetical protein